MLVTLADTKTYLGITGTTQDTKLTLLISLIDSTIKQYIGDVESGQKTEKVSYCDIGDYGTVYMSNKNITSLDEINGTTYTGVLGVDHIIDDNKLIIKDISDYLIGLEFKYFDIVYTSGYTTIPDDIKLVAYQLIGAELNKDSGKSIKEYKLGPRTIRYGTEDDFYNVKSILDKYKVFRINFY